MRLVNSVSQVKKIITSIKKKGDRIGLVPTMGYLHDGHLSLVRTARRKCDFLIVSVFVNPAQFGPKEDFHKYPRNLRRDLRLLRKEGVDLVFNPPAKAMYPEGFRTYVEVRDWSKLLCGASRPIHFRGVTTVVLKLFNILQPDIAVFGGKDYQQAVIIKKMVKDLNLSVKVMTGKIVREPDGLAMSSRNTYLSENERKNAVVLYESLKWLKQAYIKGLRDPKLAKNKIASMIKNKKGTIDYIALVDKSTLEPVSKLRKGTLIALAVFFGRTRLIDNTTL
ncbi:pantoate--beta-alanine ligase [candidate division WOR_3 bacterium SM1_77]|jgi:pantoate--beta-alanine ligase|uniref:Pantothenate synthetase n=1 Tax=candidate division WOR_3 bacterium SM1_77 TaxID=1703778 RepID=A0A0S8K127_UNCW3|nr:MAG: pantoate--beta-alanine ligase [candidate division WOR_3 bacterium SM1_77]